MNFLFEYLDLVSLPPHVFILNKGKNVTMFGLLLSILTYISLLYVTIKNFFQLHNKEYKSIIYSESQEINNFNLKDTNFCFDLELEGTEDFKKNISFFMLLTNYVDQSVVNLSYVKNKDGYCVDDKAIINSNISLVINFYCINNDCRIFKNKENFLKFQFWYKIYLLDHKNFTNPLNEKEYLDWSYYTSETTQLIIAKVKKLKYITKGGFKWDKIEERDIIGNIKETRVPSSNIAQLGAFKIEFDTNCIIYERIYPSIIDICSNIGGFKSIMKTITYFIIIIYSEINNNCFIIENIFKKSNSNIKNKIILMNKMNNIKNIEPFSINNNNNIELNQTKDDKVEKLMNNEKKDEYYKFEKLFDINFFEKIFRFSFNKGKKELMKFCNKVVKKYLSVENIILNQLYCEEYYENNKEFLNQKSKTDDNILKNT